MQSWRLKGVVLALLAVGIVTACGKSSGGRGDQELIDASSPSTEDSAIPDAMVPSTRTDATVGEMDTSTGECLAKGCVELEAELGIEAEVSCGLMDDGCGGTVDCGGCTDLSTCGGGGTPNVCGCAPRTCEQIGGATQTACGVTVSDRCGGEIAGGCGGCEGKTGDWSCNTASSVCECALQTKEAACGGAGRVCGAASAGCGAADYDCGACAATRDCTGAGACACKAPNSAYAATACGGKTCGTVLVDGCTFTCGEPCAGCGGGGVPAGGSCSTCSCVEGLTCKSGVFTCCAPATPGEVAALCAGRGCDESVTDPCTGATISCGCQAGQVCVGRTFFEAERAKKEAGKSQCVSAAEADVLGGYVAVTHQYTKFVLPGEEKAETVSLVTILKKTNGTYQMIDQGCIAQTYRARSTAPAYFNIPPSIAPLVVTGSTWERVAPKPTTPVGFEPAMPAFCTTPGAVATSGADYPTNPELESANTASSGYLKSWLGGTKACRCPAATATCSRANMSEACLPAQSTGAATEATDCRVNDPDRDGRPGYSVITELTNGPVTAVSSGDTKWTGELRSQGFHYGQAWETKPLYRHFLSCGRSNCFLLGAAGEAPGCGANGNKFNRIYLSKVADYRTFEALTCAEFYSRPLSQVSQSNSYTPGTNLIHVDGAVNSRAVQDYFNGTKRALPACGAGNACPEGTICNAGACFPMTVPGACTTDAQCNSNSANNNTPNWKCREDKSCGPSSC